jgi:hypothetical protein
MKYSNFLNQVADNLVKIAKVNEEDAATVREAYVCDLSRAFASFNRAVNHLLAECNEKDPPVDKKDHMLPIIQTATDSMAASA